LNFSVVLVQGGMVDEIFDFFAVVVMLTG
jgi:hypothetical protein